jgi:ParB-like chromosome segregation protein Spo0J
MSVKVNCKYTEMVDTDQLKASPYQTNTHTNEQIDLLSKIIKYQGWRSPIIVSNRSKRIVAGMGRLEAAKRLALKQVPVDYQDFDSDEQEAAHVTSDNAIAELSKLDLAKVNELLPGLGPDFELDLLGIPQLVLDPSELPTDSNAEKDNSLYACPHCSASITKQELKLI